MFIVADLVSLNIILIVCLSCFTFVTNQRKNIAPEMTIRESVYCTIFSVHSLLQYIVSVTYSKFLFIDMTIALKSLNEFSKQPVCVSQLCHMILQLYTLLTFICFTI